MTQGFEYMSYNDADRIAILENKAAELGRRLLAAIPPGGDPRRGNAAATSFHDLGTGAYQETAGQESPANAGARNHCTWPTDFRPPGELNYESYDSFDSFNCYDNYGFLFSQHSKREVRCRSSKFQVPMDW